MGGVSPTYLQQQSSSFKMQIPLRRIRSMRLPRFKNSICDQTLLDHFTLCKSPLPPTFWNSMGEGENSNCEARTACQVYVVIP